MDFAPGLSSPGELTGRSAASRWPSLNRGAGRDRGDGADGGLYWLHESRRDLMRQSPANDGETRGAFALRSPVRPNPIGTALVALVERRGRRSWSEALIASTERRSST